MRINIPPLTRTLLAAIIPLSVLNFLIVYIQYGGTQTSTRLAGFTLGSGASRAPYLTIVPADSYTYPWVLVVSAMVEENLMTLGVSLATVYYGGKYLERAWSSAELGKFLLVVVVFPNIITWAGCIIWYGITSNNIAIWTTVCGSVAVQSGFLVAFKQLVPEHTVTIAKGLIKIRVKHFPALFLLGNIICAFLATTYVSLSLAVSGFLISWIYLRFYKVSFPDLSSAQPSTLCGDASETFAFAYFFPEPFQTPIGVVTEQIYIMLLAAKICTPFSPTDMDISNSQAAARNEGGLPTHLGRGGAPVPGSARAEAERRRALALKALDQRLHAATSRPAPPTKPSPTADEASLGVTSYTPEGHENMEKGSDAHS